MTSESMQARAHAPQHAGPHPAPHVAQHVAQHVAPHVANVTHLAHSGAMPAAARVILKMLAGLKHGALLLKMPGGACQLFGDHSQAAVSLELKNWNLCSAALRSGDIGLASTFIAGDWKSDDLPALIELMVRNRAEIETLVYGSWWGSLLYRAKHLLNRNSRAGSRKNIHAHYDIGNAFYQLWLDPSMTYSAAIFRPEDQGDLELAQATKYRRIIDQLQLQPDALVLEIGCGWGGFAEMAVREKKVHVTGLTLSKEQLDYAQRRVDRAGFHNDVHLQLRDYRDCNGQFDAIASIEMFEAVGESYWDSYFECLARNLKRGGRACIQTIVIDDALFSRYRKGSDFIQQYIFPGGMLPSPSAFRLRAALHGLYVAEEFCFGMDYAETLRQWRVAFKQRRAEVESQGFDQPFMLTWEFYLAYCEAAFRAKNTDVMQFTLVKS